MSTSSIDATDEDYGSRESRRTHKKSRYGCKVCKQRRIKCDEGRPSCGNCLKSRRQCPYAAQAAILPSSAPTPASSAVPSSSSLSPSARERWSRPPTSLLSPANFLPEPHPSLTTGSYSLCHLELLHHFQSHMRDVFFDSETLASTYSELIVRVGITSPFLMDEILGLAAAHKSTMVQGPSRDFYCQEATRLQTRALAQFNTTQPELGEQGSLAVFLFSAMLGQHVLFDTFQQDDFPAVLDRFVHCLGLHRGICTIVSESYTRIIAQIKEIEGPDSVTALAMQVPSQEGGSGDDCAALADLLLQGDLGSSDARAYSHAIDALQLMFNNQRNSEPSSHRRHTLVQEWPVRVSAAYVNLLGQRRPEALIILAYYGVLLHNARYYWAVAGAGRFLVESITDHLGSYWAEWLQAPNRMIQETGSKDK